MKLCLHQIVFDSVDEETFCNFKSSLCRIFYNFSEEYNKESWCFASELLVNGLANFVMVVCKTFAILCQNANPCTGRI